MRRVVWAAVALWFLVIAGGAAAAERVALVIGNAAYEDSPLKNPVRDAQAMGSALMRLGFDVVQVTDGDQRTMQRAISQFGRKLQGAKVSLVYYSGHGIQAQGANHLIPIDAKLESEGDVPLELISVDAIITQLIHGGTDVNIVIFDACRTDPFQRRFRSSQGKASSGLAPVTAPRGTLIAYATAPGETADDGDGANSPYTTALLEVIDRPGLRVEDIFKETRLRLARLTNNKQLSWESSSLVGDFFFAPTNAPAATAPAPAPAALASVPAPPPKIEPTPPPASKRGKLEFDIVNATKRRVVELYLAPSNGDDWEDNVMEDSETIEAGETLEMTVDDGAEECSYDLLAVFSSGKDVEISDIDICKGKTVTIR